MGPHSPTPQHPLTPSLTTPQAWLAYSHLPTPHSAAIARTTAQRRALLRLKAELAAVSAQDEFARWAKLSRQYEKQEKTYNTDAAALAAHKARVDAGVGRARWAATTGLRLALSFWYARSAMFWLPVGMVPGVLEALLALPRAPRGSVSIQVWGTACASVLAMVGEVVQAVVVVGRGTGKGVDAGREKEAMRAGEGKKMR